MPVALNVLDAHYRSFQKQVLPVCLKNKVGAIGMKGLGGGNGIARQAGLTVEEAYRYALSQPVASQVVGMTTMEQLKQNVELAREFKALSKAEQAALVEKVKPFATDGRFEQFKSTQNSTARFTAGSTDSKRKRSWQLESGSAIARRSRLSRRATRTCYHPSVRWKASCCSPRQEPNRALPDSPFSPQRDRLAMQPSISKSGTGSSSMSECPATRGESEKHTHGSKTLRRRSPV